MSSNTIVNKMAMKHAWDSYIDELKAKSPIYKFMKQEIPETADKEYEEMQMKVWAAIGKKFK